MDADGTQAPGPSRSFTDPVPDPASRQDAVVSGFGDAEIARPVKPDPETVRRLVHAALAAEGGDDAPAPRVGGAGQTGGRAAGSELTTTDGGHAVDRAGAVRGAGSVGAAVSRTTWTHTPGEAPTPGQAPVPGEAPTPGQAPTPGEAVSPAESPAPSGNQLPGGSDAPGDAVYGAGTHEAGAGTGDPGRGRGPEDDDEPTAEIPRQTGPTGTAQSPRTAQSPGTAPILRLRRRTSVGPPRAPGPRGPVRRPSSGSTGLMVALVLMVIFILIAIQFVVSFVDSITGIFG